MIKVDVYNTLSEAFILGLDYYYLNEKPAPGALPRAHIIKKEEFETLASDLKKQFKPCRTVMLAKTLVVVQAPDDRPLQQVDSHEMLTELAQRFSSNPMQELDFLHGRTHRLGHCADSIVLNRYVVDVSEVNPS